MSVIHVYFGGSFSEKNIAKTVMSYKGDTGVSWLNNNKHVVTVQK